MCCDMLVVAAFYLMLINGTIINHNYTQKSVIINLNQLSPTKSCYYLKIIYD